MSDLEQIIKDSLDDATTEPVEVDTPEVDATTDSVEVEASPEGSDTPVEEPVAEEEAEPQESQEVASPAAQTGQKAPVEDEFAKKHGLKPQIPGQRENRLPYSAVKRIVNRAEEKVVAPLQAKINEYEGREKQYTQRLNEVGQFENLMVHDHMGFLTLLAERVPGYAEVLQYLVSQGGQAQPQAETPAETPSGDSGMPQPDYDMPDGSKVYSMKGLEARDRWNRDQARKETLTEVDKRYGFVQEERQAREWYQAKTPEVRNQIAEARTWPGWEASETFENQIAQVLANNPRWNLERAYQHVVYPKLQAQITAAQEDKTKVRAAVRTEVLNELKKAPSTSVPASGVKPRPAGAAPRSLEEIIKASIDSSGLR